MQGRLTIDVEPSCFKYLYSLILTDAEAQDYYNEKEVIDTTDRFVIRFDEADRRVSSRAEYRNPLARFNGVVS